MIVPAYEATFGASLGMLLEGHASIPSGLDRVVTAVCDDSRAVAPGALFFARKGLRVDASRFADSAIASGAAAVVIEGGPMTVRLDAGAGGGRIPHVASAIGHAASRFYGDPSEHLAVAAVTGTNGKTSVTHFTAQACGERCAVMGTLGAGSPGKLENVALTTPGPIEIHRRLAGLRDAGLDMLAMEVSSHALDQRRIEAVDVDTAVFTNLSRDHLDYHSDMAAYARAKASLFEVPSLAHAVVNVDDRFGRELSGSLPRGIESVPLTLADERSPTAARPSVQGRITEMGQGLSLDVVSPWGSGALTTRLLGRFNAYNLLAAIAVACLHGHRLDAVLDRLHGIEPIVGRMQRIGGDSRPLVVVDYSHTPDALRSALAALQPICEGALWCVFGCGGERDRGKRPQMAEAAQGCADRIIVTDDNPRGENGDAIVADIMDGFARPDAVCVERDRGRAIHRAIAGARASDVVLVAGKGHEVSQERDGARLPFSDVAVARHALEAWR
ncbi:MAG: UDP-N-acetylmuramoyl-L-alanyl-D-glutamate--2,6-diaminopimelate ligase [Thiotrichales bacterium]|nr:UDP-N-acetylmuramoyl-L-alanyl-D-glutamate--2,6-diaminopimelate ligase [Thiotrichales bacterium]